MMPDLTMLAGRYGQFEQQVREQTERWCRPFCSACRRVCCRSRFCVETRESVFLWLVVRRFSHRSVFSRRRGWLPATGCSLVAGRPPVCYEFLCTKISRAFAGDPHRRHALLVLSMVTTHVGKRAIGGRHLVEFCHAADLNRINPERFLARLREAKAAFHEAVDVLEGRSSAIGIQAMPRIVSPPRTVEQEIRRLM